MKILLLTIACALALSVPAQATTTPPYVAYVGCSVSELTVHGYHVDLGTHFWPQNSKYDSGFPSSWASTTTRYWPAFDSMNTLYPGAQRVWWQLCVQTGQTFSQTLAYAHTALSYLRIRMPTASVYVSSLGGYEGFTCATTGEDGIAVGNAVRDALVAEGGVQAGPTFPKLAPGYVYLGKPCHPNYKGQKLLGNVLLGFFG